jgi:hypothetical protein
MIILPHIGDGNDGTVMRICSHINTDKLIFPITRIDNFKFNADLLNYKEAVILDYVEYGWQWDLNKSRTHFFGINTEKFPHFQGEEWRKFDNWVTNLGKVTYLKRELLSEDVSTNCHPLDYPNWVQKVPAQTKEEFDARPLMYMFFWGRSNENRLLLHADAWKYASKDGYSLCDNIYYFENFMANESGRKAMSLWQPHYNRIEITNILSINGLAKLSIAMPGAGFKTFRATGESLVNSIVCLPENNLAWSYPMSNGINCIKVGENVMEDVLEALKRQDLYEIYLGSIELADKYRINNYVENYLLPIINKA